MRSGQTVCYCYRDISDISVGTTNPTCLYNSWGGKKSSKFRFLLVRVPQRPIRTKRTWTRENLEEAPTGETQLNIGREKRAEIGQFDKSQASWLSDSAVLCSISAGMSERNGIRLTAEWENIFDERKIFSGSDPAWLGRTVTRPRTERPARRIARVFTGTPGQSISSLPSPSCF